MHGPTAKKVLAQAFKGNGKHRLKALPKAIANPPKLLPGLVDTYAAFWELVTEKPRPEAPIPYSSIMEWSDREEYGETKALYFRRAIRKMDLALIEWRRDKAGTGKPGAMGKGS